MWEEVYEGCRPWEDGRGTGLRGKGSEVLMGPVTGVSKKDPTPERCLHSALPLPKLFYLRGFLELPKAM